MFLAIDVGNTHTVVGMLTPNGHWCARWRITTVRNPLGADWAPAFASLAGRDNIDLHAINAVCICSVVPTATTALTEFAREWLKVEPMIVRSTQNLNIRLGMDNPHEVGADRIANAVAAWDLCRSACVVVDLGTATKVEAISDEGVFLGGSIAAGIGASMEALTSRAARLFNIDLTLPESAIGRNTVEALQAGIVLGHRHLVGGLVTDIRGIIGVDAVVLLTGGYAAREDSPFRFFWQHEPDLTLNGIRLIHELNSV
jgi:type III pantothenate kinase